MNSHFLYFVTWIEKIGIRLVAMLIRSSKEKRKQWRKEATTKVEKRYLSRYLPVLNGLKADENEKKPPKKIWVCWLQGEETAPEIVKCCIEQMRRVAPDYELNIVTFGNMRQFVDLPEFIYEKNAKGIIHHTQFSDIIRAALLAKHGGIWIDSTVFLTDKFPDNFVNYPYFAMHSVGYIKNNNWIIASAPRQWIMQAMNRLLVEYWRHENRRINYFFYHIFVDLIIEKEPAAAAEWAKVPVSYDVECYDLEANLLKPFDESVWKKIDAKTTIHKLNYKYDKSKDIKGTFLEKILEKTLRRY